MWFGWACLALGLTFGGASVASGACHVAVLAQEAEVVEGVVAASLDMVDVVAGLPADDAGAMVSSDDLGADLGPVFGELFAAVLVAVFADPGHELAPTN